jgi:hypothetical protein
MAHQDDPKYSPKGRRNFVMLRPPAVSMTTKWLMDSYPEADDDYNI